MSAGHLQFPYSSSCMLFANNFSSGYFLCALCVLCGKASPLFRVISSTAPACDQQYHNKQASAISRSRIFKFPPLMKLLKA